MNSKKIKDITAKIRIYSAKAKEISIKVYNQHLKTFDPLLLSYFPFIGWFIPMTVKSRDEFYMHHAKQGFILAVFFTGACTFLYLLLYFVSVRADILKFIIVILIYVLYLVYIYIAYLGTKMIIAKEKSDFPYIGKYITEYASKLNI